MRHHSAFVVVLLAAVWGAPARAQDGPYKFAREIRIGGEGGWDYLSVDPAAHRLYVTHATKVIVIDTQRNAVAGEIADTPGVHGFAVAADIGRGFASNGRENKVSIVDLKTLKTVQKVDTGENPDAILYEPAKKEVYAFNGRGHSATVIDAQTGKVVATITLAGKPEFAQADSKAGRVFVNIEDQNAIQVIDTAKHAVVATWPIAPGESASGMAIDVEHHRLFIGCENKLMLMIDSASGAIVYSVPIGEGVDSTWYDAGTRLAFSSSGGAATVTVAREESPDALRLVQTLQTVRGARTMALDPVTHTIYLAAAEYDPNAQASGGRPTPLAGSFKVLVYEYNAGGSPRR